MNRYAFLYPTSTIPAAANRSDNRRLYSAKKLTTDHGLNTYDFEARWLAPAFPRFTTVEMVLPEDNNLEIAGHEFKHGYQFEIGKYGFTKMSSQILIYDHTDEIKAYNRSASITGLDYSDILNGETYAHLNRNPYSVRTLLEPIKEYLNNELVIERFARQKKTIFRWNGRTYIGF